MPLKHVQFTLIRPVLPARDQIRLHRIPELVKPLLPVTLAAPKLAVEKIFLPDGLLHQVWPAARGLCLPDFYPALARRYGHVSRSAEEMNVIRHDDIANDQP